MYAFKWVLHRTQKSTLSIPRHRVTLLVDSARTMVLELDHAGTIGIADPKVFIITQTFISALPIILNTIEIQSGFPKLLSWSSSAIFADFETGRTLDVVGPPCHRVFSVSSPVEVKKWHAELCTQSGSTCNWEF
jgi:hypothetical protein